MTTIMFPYTDRNGTTIDLRSTLADPAVCDRLADAAGLPADWHRPHIWAVDPALIGRRRTTVESVAAALYHNALAGAVLDQLAAAIPEPDWSEVRARQADDLAEAAYHAGRATEAGDAAAALKRGVASVRDYATPDRRAVADAWVRLHEADIRRLCAERAAEILATR